jgi:hypothetical protein
MAVGLALGTAGCATQQLDAQWSNPQQAASSLRGEKVLVVCEAAEPVIRQICQDKLAAEVTTLGAQAVRAPEPAPGDDTARAAAARAAGARAVFSVAISPDVSQATHSGMSVGFGLGGFGFGHGGFGGVGVSAPIGGDIRIQSGYAGNASLLEAKTGVLLWTAKTRSNPNENTEYQMTYLTRALAEGARKAGHL